MTDAVAVPTPGAVAAAVRPMPEVALRLFERYFLHRKDCLAFLAPWGKPCPTEPGEHLRAALLAHVVGPAAPEFRARYKTKNGGAVVGGHFRIGAYCLGAGDTVTWLCFDLDGAGHAQALADPLAAALATIAVLKDAGITGYLERSGGGKGWHVWVFFARPVAAAQARTIGLAFAPKDARLTGPAGQVADAKSGRGIEVFPKQTKLSRKGLGNQVWLPFWHAAPDGANVFWRQTATGDLEPFAPEDFETVPPELVERLAATIPVAPPKPTSVVGHDVWGAWRKKALAALDLTSVYGAHLVGENSGAGWEKCRDPWSASGDQNPSAGVADGTGEAERGTYHSFISGESMPVFDFLVRYGKAKDFSEAMAVVAELSGVPLPNAAAARSGGKPVVAAERGQILLTDLGNARRLAKRHGHALRYCAVLGWLVWDGRRWKRDDTGAAMRLAKETAESIWDAVKLATGKEQEELADWALVSQTASRLNAMLTLAATEELIAVSADAFDQDPWFLNVLNGTIDLRTGALLPHDPKNCITKLAPVMYEPTAACPRFLKFLADVFEGNAALIRFVQKALGYALTGDVSYQVLFFLHGEGSNGKSTLITVVLYVMGDYASPAAPDILLSRHGERHPTEIADLFGRRLVTCVEVGKGRSFNEALLKWLTGGDRVKARLMRMDFFDFSPTHKIFICANNKPRVKETDHAFWRRMRLVPFNVRFKDRPAGATGEPGPGEKDPFLVEKLKAEAAGILRWMVEGTIALRTEGLAPPADVEAATEAYRKGEDVLGTFLDECCVVQLDARVLKGALYDSYVSWARIAGEHVLPMREFRKSLVERGITDGRMSKGAKCWVGVGLAASEPAGDRVTAGDRDCRVNGDSRVHVAVNGQTRSPEVTRSPLDLTQFEDDVYAPVCADGDSLEAM